MTTVTITLFLLLAVVISSFLSRALPINVPLPLVQITFGALLALSTETHIELEPEIFFLLFLPPLLFLDGWRIPKLGLFRDKWTIFELSFGLVIATVVGMGFFIHWMIPHIPLPVAFILAAAISPTDPVAVSAIAKGSPIPKRLMHILEGESLLNDASALVCLRFAIAAALTGTFSLGDASLTFLQLAIGGIAIGVAVTWGITKLKGVIAREFGEEPGTQILISLLIPFGAYLAAEHLHCSGILAAVAAGITMSYAELSGQAQALTRVRRTAVWDMLHFTLNGVIFVLLGEQLPRIIESATTTVMEAGHGNPSWLIAYVFAITLGLALLRFIWVYASLRFTMFHRALQGKAVKKINPRIIAVMSVAGVRGAITLAGVLTIPLTLVDGAAFPARDLVIFLATGVMILSMLIASVALPRLLKGLELPPEPSHEADEDLLRAEAAHAAIRAIEKVEHEMAEGRSDADLFMDAGARITEIYRQRIQNRSGSDEARDEYFKTEAIERTLRVVALRAERDTIFHLARTRQIDDDIVRKLVREIDLLETQHSA